MKRQLKFDIPFSQISIEFEDERKHNARNLTFTRDGDTVHVSYTAGSRRAVVNALHANTGAYTTH